MAIRFNKPGEFSGNKEDDGRARRVDTNRRGPKDTGPEKRTDSRQAPPGFIYDPNP